MFLFQYVAAYVEESIQRTFFIGSFMQIFQNSLLVISYLHTNTGDVDIITLLDIFKNIFTKDDHTVFFTYFSSFSLYGSKIQQIFSLLFYTLKRKHLYNHYVNINVYNVSIILEVRLYI